MKNHLWKALGLALLTALPAAAQEAAPENELTVFGGIAILNAGESSELTFPIDDLPDFPSFPGFPGGLPSITVHGETSLGSSALFGARYSRRIKERVALEADFAIAPTHELEPDFEVCVERFGCFGEGTALRGLRDRGFDGRGVTAWHYGGGLTYDLAGGEVRPHLVVGAGAVTWDGASATNLVFRFGGGIKVLFGKLGVRVDVVDHLVIDHFLTSDNEHDVHATAGFLVGF
jgi:hypothetical protein